MLKKTITYENPFTEEEKVGEFYFHFSKADLVRMEIEEHDEEYTNKHGEKLTGMRAKLTRIMESLDGKAMMPTFEDLIKRSYGIKDGDNFLRSPEALATFVGSGAYDALLFELCTEAEAAGEFINGAMPHNLEEVAKQAAAQIAAQEAQEKAAKKKPAKKKAAQTDTSKSAVAATEEVAQTRAQILQDGLSAATPEKPLEVLQTEVGLIDSDDFATGVASGKIKIVAGAENS